MISYQSHAYMHVRLAANRRRRGVQKQLDCARGLWSIGVRQCCCLSSPNNFLEPRPQLPSVTPDGLNFRSSLVDSRMAGNTGNIEETLKEFSRLLDDTDVETLQSNRALIEEICKKLNKSKPSRVVSLLDALKSSLEAIKEYTEKPVKEAVTCSVDLADVDPRVQDIWLGETKHGMKTKFRKGLGELSLATDMHKWELQEFGNSKLQITCNDPEKYRSIPGRIDSFIAARHLPDDESIRKGLSHGTKLLLIDHLVGKSNASAMLLIFVFTKFREVNYPDMKTLADSLRKDSSIHNLAQKTAAWFQLCLNIYEGL
jgi:hypothetical protein